MNQPSPEPVPRRRRGRSVGLALGVVGVAIVGTGWLFRAPIVTGFVNRELTRAGIPARYEIESLSLGRQRLRNVVIGDPSRPDLTAREVEIRLGFDTGGPVVTGVSADGVRLYGRYADGKLTFGALDRLRDPDSREPFVLPAIGADLRDARARIDTPWGPVGVRLEGGGLARSGFTGTLAVAGPTLALVGCEGSGVTAYGRIATIDGAPRFAGPVRADRLVCGPGTSLRRIDAMVDASASSNFGTWKARVDGTLARGAAAGAIFAANGLRADVTGNSQGIAARGQATSASVAHPEADGRQVRLAFDLVSGGPDGLMLAGDINVARMAVRPARRAALVRAGSGLTGTPIGPLVDAALVALGDAGSQFGLTTGFRLSGSGAGRRLDVMAPSVTAANGAALTASNDSILTMFPATRRAVAIAGDWRLRGPGLPTGRLRIDRASDGSGRGLLRLDPWAAGASRLALAPVAITVDRAGGWRFATRADVSGPFAGGSVTRLTLPLVGSLSPGGTWAVNAGCHDVAYAALQTGTLRLDPGRLRLCAPAGLPMVQAGAGGVRAGATIAGADVAGRLGQSLFALTADLARVSLDRGFDLMGVNATLGTGTSATQFSAATLSGQWGDALAGRIAGGGATIGTVPLVLGDLDAGWRWQGGALQLTGAVTITDRADVDRFRPMRSETAALELSDGLVRASAPLTERESGRAVGVATIVHDLARGTGHADIDVPGIRFDDDFQPEELTPLTLGVVANVAGVVRGRGRIDWNSEGVTSTGRFATDSLDLAAAFGPVRGLAGEIEFDDLLALRTAPGQTVRLAEVNPGIAIFDGLVRYRLMPDRKVLVEGGRWPLAGGELVLQTSELDFDARGLRRLVFEVRGVDAARFMQNFGFDNINTTGTFDGVLPVVFDADGGRIEGGWLEARAGGGTIAYVGELTNRNLGPMANLAFGALKSLKYDSLALRLDGALAGEMVTAVRFTGISQGEGATRNLLTRQIARLPFVFNLKINGPFRQLISSARAYYDPRLLIDQNLPALLRAEEEAEAEARRAQEQESIQPVESRTMP